MGARDRFAACARARHCRPEPPRVEIRARVSDMNVPSHEQGLLHKSVWELMTDVWRARVCARRAENYVRVHSPGFLQKSSWDIGTYFRCARTTFPSQAPHEESHLRRGAWDGIAVPNPRGETYLCWARDGNACKSPTGYQSDTNRILFQISA